MYYLKINDKDKIQPYRSGGQLYEMLMSLNSTFRDYKWYLYDVDANQAPTTYYPLMDLREQVSNSQYGLPLSFDDLCGTVSNLDQIINLVTFAKTDDTDLSTYEDAYEWKCKFPLLIEVIDGGPWELFSSNRVLLHAIQINYKDTKLCDLNVEDPCFLKKPDK